ncbi:MAG: urate hydroxylase PuuD [Actinobacteria bacterium]|nr:urate hydroxylase PuuD [Actinomycetota bacterium]
MSVAPALVDPYVTDWLNFLLRWLHVVAAIAWIGTSFYFVFLDNALLPPKDDRDANKGVGGELWAVHGGGFYHVQKYRVAPETLPEPLHWFKWEAYTTWLSGFALLVVLYYADADLNLVDPGVADLSAAAAIAISLAGLAVAWIVYDVLCRLLHRSDRLLAGAVALFTVASAYGASELFSGRAAYIQVGSMLGTMMAGNVLFVIIPAHRELVRAKEAGREPNAELGVTAKQRSVHNNYLTLPAVFAMISNHFAIAFGHARAWLVLVAIMAIGAWVRHFFNLRRRGRTVWAIPATAGVAVVALALSIRPDDRGSAEVTPGEGSVAFAQVRSIIERRCATCHSAEPTSETYTTAPKGIAFETPAQIVAQARKIEQQAVLSKAMPPGNVTGMSQAERDELGAWIRQGAGNE